MQKNVPTEGCAKFAVEDIQQYYMVSKFNVKKKENNEDTVTKENKPEEVKCASNSPGSDVINVIVPIQILHQLTIDLGIDGRNTSLTIKTINGEFTSNSTALEGL